MSRNGDMEHMIGLGTTDGGTSSDVTIYHVPGAGLLLLRAGHEPQFRDWVSIAEWAVGFDDIDADGNS